MCRAHPRQRGHGWHGGVHRSWRQRELPEPRLAWRPRSVPGAAPGGHVRGEGLRRSRHRAAHQRRVCQQGRLGPASQPRDLDGRKLRGARQAVGGAEEGDRLRAPSERRLERGIAAPREHRSAVRVQRVGRVGAARRVPDRAPIFCWLRHDSAGRHHRAHVVPTARQQVREVCRHSRRRHLELQQVQEAADEVSEGEPWRQREEQPGPRRGDQQGVRGRGGDPSREQLHLPSHPRGTRELHRGHLNQGLGLHGGRRADS
mmetsp:Transcript_23903/g.62394  ORF Transcript_23903/g.62394 Transcript_23903/m.62394 type:complete len:259 (+) Transcript_23903:576-1352(+)